ncbi:hypothetical protein PRZ48_002500 [Zasmidium cellare]|uniref:Major facilitator superfamily (MFS) profile domain-containing protein n=1 Tax=Zasmidium cellare TaxID=395010 RepID=A0ABR0F6H1_ZASCE|nr:hypothetical protein PRZ48_002500 [Zasmidium cellare]
MGEKNDAPLVEADIANGESNVPAQHSQAPAIEYPALAALIPITVALCLAVLPVALDTTILAAAIPTITDYFGTTEDIAWYAGIYPVAICASQLAFGKLYSLYSIKWMYVSSIVIFEVGSAICGAAPTSATLIVGRAIAGLGCAGILCGSFVIVGFAVPLEKRPVFLGIISGIFGVALIAGPPVGGALSSKVSWRWCFYINLPIGAVAVLLIILLYKSPPRVLQGQTGFLGKIAEIDPFGTLILLAGVICFFLAMTWGGSRLPWNDGAIIALLVLAGVCLIAFIGSQYWNDKHATIPGKLIRQRSVASASWFAFCNSGAAWVLVYFLPIWFQAILGVSAETSGLYMLAAILAAVIASILSGAFVTVVGYYSPILILGSIFSATGAGCLTLFTINTTTAEWIGYQVLYGLGFGLSAQTPLIVVQTVLSPEDTPAGVSLIVFLQSIGGSVMIAVAQSIFFNKLILNLSGILGSDAARNVVAQGTTDYRQLIPENLRGPILEAYNNAIIDSWYTAVAVASLGIVGALACEWRSVKSANSDNGDI